MLNPFPELLDFSFFAPSLLRIAAAAAFAWIGYRQWQQRQELARLTYPVIGGGVWIVWLSAAFAAVVAAFLVFGLYTQIAALVGALGALKLFVWRNRYPSAVVLERPASGLLFVVCLSLLMTGAGALAFDIRL